MNDNDKQNGGDSGGNSPWMKSLLIWVGILAALALFVTLFGKNEAAPAGNTIPYSTFLDKIDAGEVKEVNLSPGLATGTFTDNNKFRVNMPALTQTVETALRKKGVTINVRPEESTSLWIIMLYNSLPFLLF